MEGMFDKNSAENDPKMMAREHVGGQSRQGGEREAVVVVGFDVVFILDCEPFLNS